jgi:hypothetical protein
VAGTRLCGSNGTLDLAWQSTFGIHVNEPGLRATISPEIYDR